MNGTRHFSAWHGVGPHMNGARRLVRQGFRGYIGGNPMARKEKRAEIDVPLPVSHATRFQAPIRIGVRQ